MSETDLTHPADRLLAAIEAKRAPVCVGIDPVIERLPLHLRRGHTDPFMRLLNYCMDLLEAISDSVPCVKFQVACFERHGHAALEILKNLVRLAHARNLQVILDGKRGDIGVTAEHYAAGAFIDPDFDPGKDATDIQAFSAAPDWLTINSYLGEDGITPFLRYEGHGAFALVRTSNPGGDAIQNLQLNDGRTVAQAVGELIEQIGSNSIGQSGYSSLGAVVGATKREDARRLREIMPQQIFLVPGYGAQGGGVDDVLPCFKSDGTGAIVTASRSVIYAFSPDDPKWMDSVAEAAASFAGEIGCAVGMR